jgi:phosphoserine/homoserine phosphotransferase
MQNPKKHAVAALKSLNFFTMAAGDSYNDTAMLNEADVGVFFRPPEHLPKEFPRFPVTQNYGELQERLVQAAK